ncbi:inositol oxygenase isoform X1 [Cinnamomum micranthum f. kanehirae]|uniref:Inositol oxygenase n=1 Tax=Cinnamomum micranthum f. kanehirae TaxID=337451 RepID=A0A443NNU1_9MAGN|nr:inositol oxygenase isoform X1 [Cinnamomum micranthum f. kanehirae]
MEFISRKTRISQDPVFSRKLGIYSEKCGLDRVIMSSGHDEYITWYNSYILNLKSLYASGTI